MSSVEGGRAASCGFSETETLAASFLVVWLEVEHSFFTEITSGSLNVFFTVAISSLLITNIFGSATNITIAFLAVWESVVSILTLVALSAHNVIFALTFTGQKITLKISIENTMRWAFTFFTTQNLVVPISSRCALFAERTDHVLWTLTGASFLVAMSNARAVAWSALGETVVAGFTEVTTTSDNIWFTRTLTTEFLAFEARSTVNVTTTRQGSAVVVSS